MRDPAWLSRFLRNLALWIVPVEGGTAGKMRCN